MATAADGTHPTGMHSCLENVFAQPRDVFSLESTTEVSDLLDSVKIGKDHDYFCKN